MLRGQQIRRLAQVVVAAEEGEVVAGPPRVLVGHQLHDGRQRALALRQSAWRYGGRCARRAGSRGTARAPPPRPRWRAGRACRCSSPPAGAWPRTAWWRARRQSAGAGTARAAGCARKAGSHAAARARRARDLEQRVLAAMLAVAVRPGAGSAGRRSRSAPAWRRAGRDGRSGVRGWRRTAGPAPPPARRAQSGGFRTLRHCPAPAPAMPAGRGSPAATAPWRGQPRAPERHGVERGRCTWRGRAPPDCGPRPPARWRASRSARSARTAWRCGRSSSL